MARKDIGAGLLLDRVTPLDVVETVLRDLTRSKGILYVLNPQSVVLNWEPWRVAKADREAASAIETLERAGQGASVRLAGDLGSLEMTYLENKYREHPKVLISRESRTVSLRC